MSFDLSGSVRKTADGIVGPSGKPIRVWNATVFSGGTAAKFLLRNGTDASGDPWIGFSGSVSTGVSGDWHEGRRFPDGCFYDHDTNATGAIIEFSVESA